MTLQNEKPGGESGPFKSCACGGSYKQANTSIFSPKNQAIRLPSATRYYLQRYREDLIIEAQSGNKTAITMLECCDYLLIESDRAERLL
jgi:hypothetical protein